MSQYLPKWACEKLSKMGCRSESGYNYFKRNLAGVVYDWCSIPDRCASTREYSELVPAFTPWDFCGTSEQARKNAEVVFGPEHKTSFQDQGRQFDKECKCSKCARYVCIDSKDAIEYICGFLEGE